MVIGEAIVAYSRGILGYQVSNREFADVGGSGSVN